MSEIPTTDPDATPTTPPTQAELAAATAAAQRAYTAVEALKREAAPIAAKKIRRALAEAAPMTSLMSPLFTLRVLNALADKMAAEASVVEDDFLARMRALVSTEAVVRERLLLARLTHWNRERMNVLFVFDGDDKDANEAFDAITPIDHREIEQAIRRASGEAVSVYLLRTLISLTRKEDALPPLAEVSP